MMRLGIAIALASVFVMGSVPVQAGDQPMLGQPAPGFSLESLSGDTVSLEGLRGKVVVLHFGAGW
jgi:cytochrome oxidase Cu insertion factor (SCO1/SenC/PrrC family)